MLQSMRGAMNPNGTEKRKVRRNGTRFVSPTLAGREAEIRQLIEQKKTKTAIAECMDVSRQTLRDHLERMDAATTGRGNWEK